MWVMDNVVYPVITGNVIYLSLFDLRDNLSCKALRPIPSAPHSKKFCMNKMKGQASSFSTCMELVLAGAYIEHARAFHTIPLACTDVDWVGTYTCTGLGLAANLVFEQPWNQTRDQLLKPRALTTRPWLPIYMYKKQLQIGVL